MEELDMVNAKNDVVERGAKNLPARFNLQISSKARSRFTTTETKTPAQHND